ncbi:hypothetical protein L249_3026 [Ophiocordyceps polyrhachis-furcata BCC 54312]|uniref:MYND-type domain-containing protein n=1 Tax=Ophiocordyceps polyrhachis-furcata BCC 54312 TaxID=1330021 RepID=A0A367LNM2_9HYPO|nr:hypothetical protein L249_3026 [Ophiocordyceps polyrhachis-furcata BCC 54312]
MASPPEFVCTNWTAENSECKKQGRYTCKNCLLVAYCGPECQKAHWPQHKMDCRMALGRDDWQPSWVDEKRRPAFYDKENQERRTVISKYIWGNSPAIDIVKLKDNEGEHYDRDLRLLFAASGDLRHVFKTVADLPASFQRKVEITTNDFDIDATARNIILLLIAFVVEDIEEATDCMIHTWYSASLRKSHMEILQTRIRPLIKRVCSRIKTKTDKTIVAKTWIIRGRTFRVVMPKQGWKSALDYFKLRDGLSVEGARQIRLNVTMAETRADWKERIYCCKVPRHRVCLHRFFEDGIVAPFGLPRHDFTEPNPTMYNEFNFWPTLSESDPAAGWDSKDVAETSSGPASADMYGKLYYHVRSVIQSFIRRSAEGQVSIRLLHYDLVELIDRLPGETFSRIDARLPFPNKMMILLLLRYGSRKKKLTGIKVSNVADNLWLGIHHVLIHLIPMLQSPDNNPHATLITFFMNAVDETISDQEKVRKLDRASRERLQAYLLGSFLDKAPHVELIKAAMAMDIVVRYDDTFERYANKANFCQAAALIGAAIKDRPTIVEKWPYRLKLRPGQPKAQEEFDRLLGSWAIGKERYVEWKKVDML